MTSNNWHSIFELATRIRVHGHYPVFQCNIDPKSWLSMTTVDFVLRLDNNWNCFQLRIELHEITFLTVSIEWRGIPGRGTTGLCHGHFSKCIRFLWICACPLATPFNQKWCSSHTYTQTHMPLPIWLEKFCNFHISQSMFTWSAGG